MTRCNLPPAAQREPRLGFALLAGLVVLVAAGKPILFDTMDPDCFWHLRVAEQLRSDGIGPLVDRLSYASLQQAWTPYSWLAELGMEWVWRMGGWRAAILVHSVLESCFVVFIAMACRNSASPRTSRASVPDSLNPAALGALQSVVATAAGAVLSLAYLSFRPVTAALALLSMCGWLLARDRKAGERTAAVWFLVPITVLLINLHLYAVLLPIWIGALWIGATLERRRALPEDWPEADRRVVRYGWLLVGTAAACLMTPMLPGVIGTALHYQYGDPMVASGLIAEMRPFYHGAAGKISLAVVLLMIGCALLGRRRLRPGEWLLFIAATALLLRLGRFAPAFAIVAAPIFAATMPALSSRILRKPVVLALIAIVLAGGMVRLCLQFPRSGTKMETWLNRHGPDTPGYPCAAADFIAATIKPATGRLINEFTWGGYLEWRLGDQYQTLLDGRTQLFSSAFWRATYLGSDQVRESYLSQLQADAALLPTERSVFADVLIRQGWKVAYHDERAQVLLPPESLTKDQRPRWPFATVLFDE